MMAEKARLFGDNETLVEILGSTDPHTAKGLGRRVGGFDEKVGKANARRLVTEGNVHKVSQNSELKSFLKSTGDAVLVEASPRDCIWGLGWDKKIQDRKIQRLGVVKICWWFALMDVWSN